jgi:hypothetical protein
VFREQVRAGGLLAYAAKVADLSCRAAFFVDRILKGARPTNLPIEQPTKFELVINLKTAKALSIEPTLLACADHFPEISSGRARRGGPQSNFAETIRLETSLQIGQSLCECSVVIGRSFPYYVATDFFESKASVEVNPHLATVFRRVDTLGRNTDFDTQRSSLRAIGNCQHSDHTRPTPLPWRAMGESW